jgi:hypothetical protein
MAWRLARSLATLRNEVRTLHPGTRVDTIGDADHAGSASDHNPNAAEVVCAADFFADRGLKLGDFAEHLRRTNHRAVKYVIYNRRLWSKTRAGEGWRPYNGSNPHTSHVHVSVGVGPDGRSTGPYDDTSPWGLLEDDMPLSDGDIAKVASAVYARFTHQVTENMRAAKSGAFDVGYSIGAQTAFRESWAYGKENAAAIAELRGQVAGLTVLVQQLATAPPVPLTPEQFEQLLDIVAAAAREPGQQLAAALAAAGGALQTADDKPA